MINIPINSRTYILSMTDGLEKQKQTEIIWLRLIFNNQSMSLPQSRRLCIMFCQDSLFSDILLATPIVPHLDQSLISFPPILLGLPGLFSLQDWFYAGENLIVKRYTKRERTRWLIKQIRTQNWFINTGSYTAIFCMKINKS